MYPPAETSGREREHSRDELGMSTAEYAVGTVAATGFASLLYLFFPWIEAIIRACIMASASFAARTPGPVM